MDKKLYKKVEMSREKFRFLILDQKPLSAYRSRLTAEKKQKTYTCRSFSPYKYKNKKYYSFYKFYM